MSFIGTWHIYEMENWNEDYFNMEVQAYITINSSYGGEFQFGLVYGNIDGELASRRGVERLEFTWEGNDECDTASGSGWLKMKGMDEIEGEFRIHHGDNSTFYAKKAIG